jgi:hypothetical protein
VGNFRNLLGSCGMAASYSFIAQPQINGVVELRAAIAAFEGLCGEQWPHAKSGLFSPAAMSQA